MSFNIKNTNEFIEDMRRYQETVNYGRELWQRKHSKTIGELTNWKEKAEAAVEMYHLLKQHGITYLD